MEVHGCLLSRLSHAIMENSTSDNTEWLRRAFIRPPEFVFGSPRRGAACMFSTDASAGFGKSLKAVIRRITDAPEGLCGMIRLRMLGDGGSQGLARPRGPGCPPPPQAPRAVGLPRRRSARRLSPRTRWLPSSGPKTTTPTHATRSDRRCTRCAPRSAGKRSPPEERRSSGSGNRRCHATSASSQPRSRRVRRERALELYRGGFLEGVHVSEAPEFERWVDQEREHLRRRATEAAQTLAERAADEGTRWAHPAGRYG